MLKLPRAGVMERDQRILDVVKTFLLGVKILDTVLFRDFREERREKRKREEKVKVSAVLKG